jgi:hypothetical protein
MSNKYLRALRVAMLHVAVLMTAHATAEYAADVGREIALLVRDELAIDVVGALAR